MTSSRIGLIKVYSVIKQDAVLATVVFPYQSKAKAIEMYMNNVGIRKTAKFIQRSPSLILRWIKALSDRIACQLEEASKQVSA